MNRTLKGQTEHLITDRNNILISEFDYFKKMITNHSVENLSIGERVYKNAYLSRIVEVMGKHFPTLQFILDDDFFAVVSDYVKSLGVCYWSIDHLPKQFPDFLYKNSEQYDFGVAIELMADIARFEQAQSFSFIAKDEQLLNADILGQINAEAWNHLKITLAASSNLLKLNYPIHDIIINAKNKILIQPPQECATIYFLYRLENQVHWMILPERLYLFLKLQMSINLSVAMEQTENDLEVVTEFTQLLIQYPHAFKKPEIITGPANTKPIQLNQ